MSRLWSIDIRRRRSTLGIAFSKLSKNASQLLSVLTYFGRGWIDTRHFTSARDDPWIRRLVQTGVANGYPKALFGSDAGALFNSAVKDLVKRGFVQLGGEDGAFLRVTRGFEYSAEVECSTKHERYNRGYAFLLVAIGAKREYNIENIEEHMNACLMTARKFVKGAESVMGRDGWVFLLHTTFMLAERFAARRKYEEAEELYRLSIGSDMDGGSWYQLICIAMVRGFGMNDWESAENGIKEAMRRRRTRDADDIAVDIQILLVKGREYVREFPEHELEWKKLVRMVVTNNRL
jgi:hypothetical protein